MLSKHKSIVKYRFHHLIPKVLPIKNPSPLIDYLLFSNIASFLYYTRVWNGDLLVPQSLGFSEAESVSLALVTQLLSKDSQEKVKEGGMISAYLFDHLYFLQLFKNFEKSDAGRVKEFQRLVLFDLKTIFGGESPLSRKSVVFECLIRYYDLIHSF